VKGPHQNSAGRTSTALKRSLLTGVLAAGAAAALICVITVGAAGQAPVARESFAVPYNNRVLHDGLEILLVQSDGQAFATLARDPSLSRPADFGTTAEAAYRWQRPLLSYAAWTASFGRPGWVPPALAILFVAATGAAAAGLALLLERRGCRPWPAIGLMLLPGTYASLEYFGPELLGLALVVWGLVAWTDQRHPRAVTAIVLFTLAGLARETFLLVPAALALSAVWNRRFRDAALLATSTAGWCAWIVVVRVRAGAWPMDAGEGRLTRPFAGLITAFRHAPASATLPYLVLGAVLAVVVAILCRRDALCVIVVVHAAFASLLGEFVWADWQFYARVLLPMYALGFVALLGRVLGTTRADFQPAGAA
jgi:hypothetical protein